MSIWQEIVKQMPRESTIYIADSKNCPYGSRAPHEIFPLAKRIVQFLLEKKVKVIVVACNTISVCALKELRGEYKTVPIVGIVPVIKTAAIKTKNKYIGIFSTVTTAKSGYEKELIKTFTSGCKVTNIGTEKLVPFIERGDIDSEEVKKVIKIVTKPFVKNNIDVIALGCSHFPFLAKPMQEILGKNVLILDSARAVGRHVGRVLTKNNMLTSRNKAQHQFFTTGNANKFEKVAEKLIGDTIRGNVIYVRL